MFIYPGRCPTCLGPLEAIVHKSWPKPGEPYCYLDYTCLGTCPACRKKTYQSFHQWDLFGMADYSDSQIIDPRDLDDVLYPDTDEGSFYNDEDYELEVHGG